MEEELRQAYRDVARGAGVVFVGMVLEYLLAFLVQVIAARYLSVSAFGGIVTGTAILNIGMILGTAGLGTGVARFIPRTEDREERLTYLYSAVAIVVPLSIVIGFGVAIGSSFIATTVFGDPTVTSSVFIFGLAIPAAALLRLSVGGIRGQGVSRYRVYVENLLQPISRFFLIILVTLLGLDQAGVALAYAIPYALGATFATWLLRVSLDGYRLVGPIDRRKVKELIKFSSPHSVGSVAWFSVRSLDVFLILALLGSEQVGIYGVAYGLARVLAIFSTAFNFLGMPVSSKLDADENSLDLIRVNESIVRWLIVLSVPAVFPFLVYSSDLLRFVYRPEYAAGGSALAILSLGFVAHNVLSPSGTLLASTGRTEYGMIDSVVAAIVNLVLNLYLIPRYGIVGAAVATTASYVLADLLAVIQIRVFVGFSPISRRTATPSLLGIPVLYSGALIADRIPVDPITVFGLTALVGVSYLLLFVVVVGFLPEEVMVAQEAQDRLGIQVPGLDAVLERFS